MFNEFERLLYEAFIYYERKDFRSALAACEKLLVADNEHMETLYLTGLCHARAGNPEIGITFINQAISVKPELENYDFRRDLLIQRAVIDNASLWDERFNQYCLFQAVDAFLISYPKCGRTWLRALLGKYVLGARREGDPLELFELTRSLPDFCTLEVSHDDYPHWKSCNKIFTNKKAYAGKKVIFLVRDPRDVLVSYYFQYTKRGDKYQANDKDFDGSISNFIRHDIGGLRSLVSFYNVWAANRNVPSGFLLVTYENMQRDTRGNLLDIVAFLDWPKRDAAFVDDVVSFGSFENMRKLEETNALNSARLRPPRDNDPEGFKVRRGKVGGYTDYLTKDDIRYIDEYVDQNMDEQFSFYKSTSV